MNLPTHILVQRGDEMENILVFPAGTGEAISFAGEFLRRYGIALVDHPTPEVTHLLLDVPSKEVPVSLLERLPEKVAVVGGNLDHTELAGYRKVDLLREEGYLSRNAAITAECAVRVAAEHKKSVLSGTAVLVIGWGHIGKCLAALLRSIGCEVTVAARRISDRAMLEALGFTTADPVSMEPISRFAVIFNTAPEAVLGETQLSQCPETLKIDLASRRGLGGSDVIWARGLPGRYAPESSGKLIAETLLKLFREGAS